MALADRRTFEDAPAVHIPARRAHGGRAAGSAGTRPAAVERADSGRAPAPLWQSTRSAASYLMVGIPFGIGLVTAARWVAEVIA